MADPYIYKILSRTAWAEAEAAGVFLGAAIDLKDGYIHFSTASQVRTTAKLHFAGQKDLLLIAVDPAKLSADLKYEASRGGALFPHLYGPLPLAAAAKVSEMPLDVDGAHMVPDWLGED